MVDGRAVNHQWSKSLEFETRFPLGPRLDVRGVVPAILRDPANSPTPSSGWPALRHAHRLTTPWFRSCNRAFHIDPAQRLDHWCGRCDKCCFIDLILAPFMDRAELVAVFGGREPLEDPRQRGPVPGPAGDWAPG